MAEPTEVVSEGYRWGVAGVALVWILRWFLPKGYRFRWIRLYAERDDPPPTPPPTDEEVDDD